MTGRFTARRNSGSEPARCSAAAVACSRAAAGRCCPTPSFMTMPEPAKLPAEPANPLHSDKYLDAKVRLHRRLIEEINLSALEKLPEDEMRAHIQQLVTQYTVSERLALNTHELNEFVSEILDEMTGLGPLGAAAQGPEHQRHPDQRPRVRPSSSAAVCLSRSPAASRTRRICCASSTRSSRRSAAGSMNCIRCAMRACSTARASTWRCGRSASTARWCRSGNSPRSRSTSTSWSISARSNRRWPNCWPRR